MPYEQHLFPHIACGKKKDVLYAAEKNYKFLGRKK